MARLLTQAQKDLLRAPVIKARILVTFYLDEGTYRFCDDVYDNTDGVNTYLGANALTESVEIRSGRDLSAEPITLVLDGNRMQQFGIQDPARVLADILTYLHQQRRVDIAFGIGYPDQAALNLVIPVAAMKINYARMMDPAVGLDKAEEVHSKLEIVMDSLAARYNRASHRTRSDGDQREIDPTDAFFSFASDIANSEKSIYWGKAAPFGGGSAGGGTPVGGSYNGLRRSIER